MVARVLTAGVGAWLVIPARVSALHRRRPGEPPLALAALYELVKAVNTARDNGATDEQLNPAQATLHELTSVLGLRLQEKQGSGDADKFIDLLVEVRSEVRKQKLWQLSDLIRDKLKEQGIAIEDTKEGTKWRWG